jgi:hypothetical protein
MISTRCISPTDSVCTGRVGSTSRPYSLALAVMRWETSARLQALVQAEPDVLGHGERVEQAEVLEHHADAQRPRLLRVAHVHRLAVPQHAAFVGLDRAVDDLHQRGLAGAVLAQHGVGLAGLHRQRDAAVGHHAG